MLCRHSETRRRHIHPVGQETGGCQLCKYGFSMIGRPNKRGLTRSFPQLTQGTWHDVGWINQHTICVTPSFSTR